MLTSIKIAGFKSFADPASITLDDNLVGIVGPNGCGKSNVADALRWVLGEGSAKSLRAENMGEVIFVGTRSRKALSRADVELVFDNQQGAFGGEYARYSEISVRREVLSSGESRYFLNGSVCRRRDIAGLFLGTGLGSPNYAIVQQGMINRFIEARPDELRLYLEEAAGISYFRRQKKESESNLRRANVNLEQVRERLGEINRHIAQLEKQTRNAVRHRELSEELVELKAVLYQRQGEKLDSRIESLDKHIQERVRLLEEKRSTRDELAQAQDEARIEQGKLRQRLDDALKQYYHADNQCKSLGQDISRSKEEIERIGATIEELGASGEDLRLHIEAEGEHQQRLSQGLEKSDGALSKLAKSRDESLRAYKQAEASLAQLRQRCQEAQNQMQASGQRQEFDVQRASSLEEDIKARRKRLVDYDGQLRALDVATIEKEREECQRLYQERQQELGAKERRQQELMHASQQAQKEWQASSQRLDKLRERQRELVHSLADQRARQEALLGQDPGDSVNWLGKSRWSGSPRLRALLKVEPGWELAAELVLSRLLNAVATEAAIDELGSLPDFGDGELALLLKPSAGQSPAAPAESGFARYVSGPPQLSALLENVYAAQSIDEALEIIRKSPPESSVVLPEGVWISRNWLRVLHKSEGSDRVMVREQKISELQGQLDEVSAQQEALAKECEELAAQRDGKSEQASKLQEEITQAQGLLAQLAVRLANAQAAIEAATARAREMEEAASALREELGALEEEHGERLGARERSIEAARQLEGDLAKLRGEEAELAGSLGSLHEDFLARRDEWQSAQVATERDRQELDKLNSNIERFTDQAGQQRQRAEILGQRRDELLKHIKDCETKLIDAKAELEQQRRNRAKLEHVLEESGQVIDADSAKLAEHGREIEGLGGELSDWRIELGRCQSEAENVNEHINELSLEEGFEPSEDIGLLDDEEVSGRLERARRRLDYIGPVNLIAESEYQEERERATELTAQIEDLEKSCASLRETMERMETEITRKYQDTFERVNSNIKGLFQRMFSGGDAYLRPYEDAEDENPRPGVVLMAQPPGKRIARVQQLSGGERTLSSIALMFSFFKLNPAPFCMLDEVDAPLDDINVNRFSALLGEMSKATQFIIITHNKITMSRMHMLYGVTMPDPGISRIVDVDLKSVQQSVA